MNYILLLVVMFPRAFYILLSTDKTQWKFDYSKDQTTAKILLLSKYHLCKDNIFQYLQSMKKGIDNIKSLILQTQKLLRLDQITRKTIFFFKKWLLWSISWILRTIFLVHSNEDNWTPMVITFTSIFSRKNFYVNQQYLH